MFLSSFSMMEPRESVYLYYPCWLNVWESHLYKQALKSTAAHAWGFKRFGTHNNEYGREMIRTPSYKEYIDAMEQVSETALQKLTARERMQLFKSRTAFIYVDSWGESAPFENISSALHTAMIDTLPKNLVKKFSASDFTCKIRGEKQSLVQAMQLAEDYLKWQVFDFVVICAAYRAVPILVFSEEDIATSRSDKISNNDCVMNRSVERVGCFIFSQREAELQVNCGRYITPGIDKNWRASLVENQPEVNLFACSGLRKSAIEQQLLNVDQEPSYHAVNLIEMYGGSGCLSPALSWIYLAQQAAPGHGKMRTLVPDNFGGYSWFDTRY